MAPKQEVIEGKERPIAEALSCEIIRGPSFATGREGKGREGKGMARDGP